MLRAACGSWKGTEECTDCGDSRTSFKRRMDIWIYLTNHGFNGRVHDVMEKKFMVMNKFNVVELCRKSDVESKFNSCALQSVAMCQPGKTRVALQWYDTPTNAVKGAKTGRDHRILILTTGRERKCVVLGRCKRQF